MSQTSNTAIAVIGIDIGKNSFHVVGHDARGAIVLRQKWSRGQVEARLANLPPRRSACLKRANGLMHRSNSYLYSITSSGSVNKSRELRLGADSYFLRGSSAGLT